MIIGGKANNENAKGVIQLSNKSYTEISPFPIVGINITTNNKVIEELKKYTKGFFFVRQKRIPLTLCQGIVIGLDNESKTPTLPTRGGVLKNFNSENLQYTYVETSAINKTNFVSEGFLSRFSYTLSDKETNGWNKFLTTSGIILLATLSAAVVIFTCGAGAAVVGAGLAAAWGGGIAALTGTAGIIAGSVAGAGILTSAVINSAQSINFGSRPIETNEQNDPLYGRNEKINEGQERKENDQSRILTHEISDRYIIKDLNKNSPSALIVPDYQVNQPYYNQFLTGNDFVIKLTHEQSNANTLTSGYFTSDQRHFYVEQYVMQNDTTSYNVKLVGVPDGCPIKMIGENKYHGRAGYPEEAYQYLFQGTKYNDNLDKKENSDIIRGNFGTYVGMQGYSGHATDQVNIMIPGYKENKLFDYIQIRAQDTSAFYAISDRIDINNINKKTTLLNEADFEINNFSEIYYRGDSYICQYTHRINRNFNDPSAPYNDVIVDEKTWKENYNPDTPENYANINLGDINAVQLGMWLTFNLRSSYNLNIRTIDKSHIDEYIMCGNYRSFYPNYGQLAHGSQKIPDSEQYNKGFSKSVSEKYYFEVPNVPYIKQEFQNRIIFSDIHINDAYKNGFRVIRTMNHKDFPMTYGSITKLIELKNALLIIFEHGIGLVTINNNSEHSSQILSDLNIISDVYGSQWKDSILKTPSGVYGVDTIAKKIWRVKNGQLEIISDFKVQEFLNQNITLSERELSPILGIRNVKTFYNAFKHDVMFTFYDNLHGISEKSWNLCWNEILNLFTTFYSWIPNEMQNIDNIPFSFNRDTVKTIAKLGVSNHNNDYSDGITLSNNVIYVKNQPPIEDPDTGDMIYQKPTFEITNKSLQVFYLNEQGEYQEYDFDAKENVGSDPEHKAILLSKVLQDKQFIGFLHLDNRSLPDGKVRYHINYELMRDRQNNQNIFEIKNVRLAVKTVNEMLKKEVKYIDLCYLALKKDFYVSDLLSEIYYRNIKGNAHADYDTNKIAPKPNKHTLTNKKIKGTQIINTYILNKLREQYGDDHPVGNDTSRSKDTAYHCGFIGEIYEKYSDKLYDIPDGQDPETWIDDTSMYHGIKLADHWLLESEGGFEIYTDLPIFKNKSGKRVTLPKNLQINPDKIVRYLNIKAKVTIEPFNNTELSATEAYYNQFANGDHEVCMIDAGYFESQVAITTSFNLSLLSTDFWKHGQAGLIDITDKVYPTYWYGQQHPFEFECVVANNPEVHKIFTNLELVANHVKPESFHYEVVGDCYDFSEDKPTMYFRQEALKALYQYNGYDIEYNPNFLNIDPKQHNRSADFPKYYSRWDSINDIYDSYKRFSAPIGFNYDHLAGAEIVYYPTRNEFRIWNHVEAIDMDSLSSELATSIIKANCRYLEDKWLVSINPIVVTYKNEFDKIKVQSNDSIFSKDELGVYKYSSWIKNYDNTTTLPPINIQGTKLEEQLSGNIEFPQGDNGRDNALYELYDLNEWNKGSWKPIDPTKNSDRRETDVRGKFIKIRIRYSGEELAIIDFLNTIYQISFA